MSYFRDIKLEDCTRISVFLDRATYLAVAGAAKESNTPMTRWVEKLIAKELRKRKPAVKSAA